MRQRNHGGLAKQCTAQVTFPDMSQCLSFCKKRSAIFLQTARLNGLLQAQLPCNKPSVCPEPRILRSITWREKEQQKRKKFLWKWSKLHRTAGLARTAFPSVSNASSAALGRKRRQGLNEVIPPGNKWPGRVVRAAGEAASCFQIGQIYLVLWTGKFYASLWTVKAIKAFSALLLKGKYHHALNNPGSGLSVPTQVACAAGGYAALLFSWACLLGCRRWTLANTLLSAFLICNDACGFYSAICLFVLSNWRKVTR